VPNQRQPRLLNPQGSGISIELLREKLLRLGNDPLEIVEFEAELRRVYTCP
jgi:hypothetical protein